MAMAVECKSALGTWSGRKVLDPTYLDPESLPPFEDSCHRRCSLSAAVKEAALR